MNNLKVFLLMAGMTALLGALGSVFGGQSGLVIALVFAAGMNFFILDPAIERFTPQVSTADCSH